MGDAHGNSNTTLYPIGKEVKEKGKKDMYPHNSYSAAQHNGTVQRLPIMLNNSMCSIWIWQKTHCLLIMNIQNHEQ